MQKIVLDGFVRSTKKGKGYWKKHLKAVSSRKVWTIDAATTSKGTVGVLGRAVDDAHQLLWRFLVCLSRV